MFSDTRFQMQMNKEEKKGVTCNMKIQLSSRTWQPPAGSGYGNPAQQYSSLLAHSQARSCPQEHN